MVYQRPKGTLTIKGELISLDLPKVLTFENKSVVEAIDLIKRCVGLSDHERAYLTRAIYLKTDKRPWPFL